MAKSIDQKLHELPPERRKSIEARSQTLIAEELSLQALRKAHRLTQKQMAIKLGVGQERISRIEQRSDLLLSTLRSYVTAMGGTLAIVAEFPDQPPIKLAGFAELE